jgi:transcriptional regulator with XRE-family HTH domain
MSYQMRLDPKSRKSAKFISRLQKKIQQALSSSGKTQQDIASILGVDRSVVNRRIKGSANLTARSIAEFAFALDKDIKIEFVDTDVSTHTNWAKSSGGVFETEAASKLSARGTVQPQAKYIIERTAS